MIDPLNDLVRSLEKNEERIVCQVVETKGSTPQKAGSMMGLDPSGSQSGTLGGGCVENEVKMKAMRLLGVGGDEVYSFLLDHDYAWADGLICGGKMVMTASSVRGPEALAYFQSLLQARDKARGYTEAICVEKAGAGSRILFDSEGDCLATYPEELSSEFLLGRVKPLKSRPKPYKHEGWVFIPSSPRIQLLIVGAGHVGASVADLAASCDFDLWILDDRAEYADSRRFPYAKRVIVGPFEETLPMTAEQLTRNSYALIVTRGHGHDQEALEHLAPSRASHVGLIGSKRKIRMIFESLLASGISEEDLRRVTAPIGLPIGSQSVPEIAVSIVAQLIQRRNLGPTRSESDSLDSFFESGTKW